MADQAAEQTAKINLGYTEIRSPIDGRTGNLMLHPGNLVKANDSASTIVVINQLKPIYVDFNVPEKDLDEVRRDMAGHQLAVVVRPRSRELQAASESGTLSFIDNTVNANTGTFELKGLFANAAERLWPGQYVNVTLTLAELPDTILVPSQAVQTGQGGSFVYVVEQDMSAKTRPVVLGDSLDGQTVIKSGAQGRGNRRHRRPAPPLPRSQGEDQDRTRSAGAAGALVNLAEGFIRRPVMTTLIIAGDHLFRL